MNDERRFNERESILGNERTFFSSRNWHRAPCATKRNSHPSYSSSRELVLTGNPSLPPPPLPSRRRLSFILWLYVYMYSLLHSTPTPFSASPLTSPRVCLSLIELESFRLVVRYRAHFSALPFNPHCCLLSHDPRASFSCLSAFSCGISSLFSLLFLPHR